MELLCQALTGTWTFIARRNESLTDRRLQASGFGFGVHMFHKTWNDFVVPPVSFDYLVLSTRRRKSLSDVIFSYDLSRKFISVCYKGCWFEVCLRSKPLYSSEKRNCTPVVITDFSLQAGRVMKISIRIFSVFFFSSMTLKTKKTTYLFYHHLAFY